MKKFFSKYYARIITFLILFSTFSVPFVVLAAEPVKSYNILENGGGATFGSKAGYTAISDPTASVAEKVAGLISIVLSFLGVIFLVLMIYAGYLWMTASGNETRIKDSQKIMKNAIIGLIIVLMAYIITAFIGRILAPTTTGV